MDQLVLDPLSGITSSLTSLTSSLTTTNTFATAPAATQAILSADDALSSALATLKKHQRNYAHILHLRSEAVRLENQIKDVIRQCNAYTSEINAISPAILEDSDSDDDGEESKGEVDYNTLLTLASRIAIYNTAAQREAETSVQKMRRITQTNGISESHTEPGMEITSITDAEIARDRAMKGMAFPDAEILRLGALGRLQVIREQRGEDAVDAEAERLMRQTEGEGLEKADSDVKMEAEDDANSSPRIIRTRRASQNQRSGQATTRTQPPQEKKKLKLDLWEGDEDDDD